MEGEPARPPRAGGGPGQENAAAEGLDALETLYPLHSSGLSSGPAKTGRARQPVRQSGDTWETVTQQFRTVLNSGRLVKKKIFVPFWEYSHKRVCITNICSLKNNSKMSTTQ